MSKTRKLPQYPRRLWRQPSKKELIAQALERQRRHRHNLLPEEAMWEPPPAWKPMG